jgi:hypothetical protein
MVTPISLLFVGAHLCVRPLWADTQVRPYGGMEGEFEGRVGDLAYEKSPSPPLI